MTETRWWAYLQRLMGDDNAMTAAQRAGISASNFSRWKKGANADPEFVVKIARAYHANVLEALVEAEFITDSEAGLTKVPVGHAKAIRESSMEELVDELQRKIRNAYAHGQLPPRGGGEAVTGVDAMGQRADSNVHDLASKSQSPEGNASPDFSKMAARKSRKAGEQPNDNW
ncbi:hypothetical protein GS503_14220 [Rhodococcus hoagii]|nr:hypothetical protein [Prescottella equi]